MCKEGHWKSSLWTSPAKFIYPQDEHSTNVQVYFPFYRIYLHMKKNCLFRLPHGLLIHRSFSQVPPLTLPSWSQILSGDGISSLLSPTKNLLPAAANPLYPATSPYYHKSVVAPHPSELPLPSLSLTPKKKTAANARLHFNLASSKSEDNIIEDDESSDSHSTSSKFCK